MTPSECATPAPASPSSDGALSVRPFQPDGDSVEPELCEGSSPRLAVTNGESLAQFPDHPHMPSDAASGDPSMAII